MLSYHLIGILFIFGAAVAEMTENIETTELPTTYLPAEHREPTESDSEPNSGGLPGGFDASMIQNLLSQLVQQVI